jgi:hypothetical protein
LLTGNMIGRLSGWNKKHSRNNLIHIKMNSTGKYNYTDKYKSVKIYLVCNAFLLSNLKDN